MELLAFLLFFLCFSAGKGNLSMVAEKSPPQQPRLDLNCSLTSDTNAIDRVMVIQLEKVVGSEKLSLASVVAGENARFNTDFPGRVASVDGKIFPGRPKDSFLRLTVEQADDADIGNYVCVMSYMDHSSFLLLREEATTIVTKETLGQYNPLLVEELLELKDQVARLTHQLQSMHTTVAPATTPASAHAHAPEAMVAFSARPVALEPFVNDTLTFRDVTLNLGGAYNSTTGCFVAPVNGTYVFMAALSVSIGKALAELKVNGVTKGQLAARGDDQTSISEVLELRAEDRVCLRGIFASTVHTDIFADRDTVFSGFLLRGDY